VDFLNSRERFLDTMSYGSPDRVPYFDEGLRDGVLEAWRKEGLADGADLDKMFHFDRRERIPVNLDPLPSVKKWPTSRRDLAAFRDLFDARDAKRLPDDWAARVAAWRTREHILELALHPGFFLAMGVEDWPRFEEVIYQLADDASFVREMLMIRGEFIAEMAERVLGEVEIDFASFSEPIGGNEGPLVSPEVYRNVILPSYRPILDVLARHDVRTVAIVTYANARALMTSLVDAGFSCLWAVEADTKSMDYLDLRREFGRSLTLIGGIDLDTLLSDRDAIRREIETKVPPLLAQGGYIPLADGRVRANTGFANYAYYRRILEEVTLPGPRTGF
jgi:uroporphyrinogen decarboxylase